ncbi:MAG: hypothetical protein A2539_08090 [Elusimicrobia bacterium RIFOXYD2_FULL_34_15]|nr:MAG: hypothetical protein A2539_08090 [Elusimicrobia bacterium RIFOXYD2_FULL_34_15]
MKKPKILIVDDDPSIVELVRVNLEGFGYQLTTAYDGKKALELVENERFDLIILDIILPEVNGFIICQSLRKKRINLFTPIIVISAKDKSNDKITGLKLGADEYMTKPFNIDELIIRVDALLKRTKHILSANPLTHLPGNVSIMQEVNRQINIGEKFAFAYLDINNFKAYNDKYGFEKGDDVIKFTAEILKQSTNNNIFIGHIGGDDFILICKPDECEMLCLKIIELFDRRIKSFYNSEDLKIGYIIEKNRKGKRQRFNIMTLSIGIVTNEDAELNHYGKIVELVTETKKYAKIEAKGKKSCFVFNRRKNNLVEV